LDGVYKYVEVDTLQVPYDTLVSMMKPYGLKVLDTEKLKTILNLPKKKIKNALYDEEYASIKCKTIETCENYQILYKNLEHITDENIRSLTLCYADKFGRLGSFGPFFITNEEKLKTMNRDALLKNITKIIGEISMELRFRGHKVNPSYRDDDDDDEDDEDEEEEEVKEEQKTEEPLQKDETIIDGVRYRMKGGDLKDGCLLYIGDTLKGAYFNGVLLKEEEIAFEE
jgi:hypothetical protein